MKKQRYQTPLVMRPKAKGLKGEQKKLGGQRNNNGKVVIKRGGNIEKATNAPVHNRSGGKPRASGTPTPRPAMWTNRPPGHPPSIFLQPRKMLNSETSTLAEEPSASSTKILKDFPSLKKPFIPKAVKSPSPNSKKEKQKPSKAPSPKSKKEPPPFTVPITDIKKIHPPRIVSSTTAKKWITKKRPAVKSKRPIEKLKTITQKVSVKRKFIKPWSSRTVSIGGSAAKIEPKKPSQGPSKPLVKLPSGKIKCGKCGQIVRDPKCCEHLGKVLEAKKLSPKPKGAPQRKTSSGTPANPTKISVTQIKKQSLSHRVKLQQKPPIEYKQLPVPAPTIGDPKEGAKTHPFPAKGMSQPKMKNIVEEVPSLPAPSQSPSAPKKKPEFNAQVHVAEAKSKPQTAKNHPAGPVPIIVKGRDWSTNSNPEQTPRRRVTLVRSKDVKARSPQQSSPESDNTVGVSSNRQGFSIPNPPKMLLQGNPSSTTKLNVNNVVGAVKNLNRDPQHPFQSQDAKLRKCKLPRRTVAPPEQAPLPSQEVQPNPALPPPPPPVESFPAENFPPPPQSWETSQPPLSFAAKGTHTPSKSETFRKPFIPKPFLPPTNLQIPPPQQGPVSTSTPARAPGNCQPHHSVPQLSKSFEMEAPRGHGIPPDQPKNLNPRFQEQIRPNLPFGKQTLFNCDPPHCDSRNQRNDFPSNERVDTRLSHKESPQQSRFPPPMPTHGQPLGFRENQPHRSVSFPVQGHSPNPHFGNMKGGMHQSQEGNFFPQRSPRQRQVSISQQPPPLMNQQQPGNCPPPGGINFSFRDQGSNQNPAFSAKVPPFKHGPNQRPAQHSSWVTVEIQHQFDQQQRLIKHPRPFDHQRLLAPQNHHFVGNQLTQGRAPLFPSKDRTVPTPNFFQNQLAVPSNQPIPKVGPGNFFPHGAQSAVPPSNHNLNAGNAPFVEISQNPTAQTLNKNLGDKNQALSKQNISSPFKGKLQIFGQVVEPNTPPDKSSAPDLEHCDMMMSQETETDSCFIADKIEISSSEEDIRITKDRKKDISDTGQIEVQEITELGDNEDNDNKSQSKEASEEKSLGDNPVNHLDPFFVEQTEHVVIEEPEPSGEQDSQPSVEKSESEMSFFGNKVEVLRGVSLTSKNKEEGKQLADLTVVKKLLPEKSQQKSKEQILSEMKIAIERHQQQKTTDKGRLVDGNNAPIVTDPTPLSKEDDKQPIALSELSIIITKTKPELAAIKNDEQFQEEAPPSQRETKLSNLPLTLQKSSRTLPKSPAILRESQQIIQQSSELITKFSKPNQEQAIPISLFSKRSKHSAPTGQVPAPRHPTKEYSSKDNNSENIGVKVLDIETHLPAEVIKTPKKEPVQDLNESSKEPPEDDNIEKPIKPTTSEPSRKKKLSRKMNLFSLAKETPPATPRNKQPTPPVQSSNKIQQQIGNIVTATQDPLQEKEEATKKPRESKLAEESRGSWTVVREARPKKKDAAKEEKPRKIDITKEKTKVVRRELKKADPLASPLLVPPPPPTEEPLEGEKHSIRKQRREAKKSRTSSRAMLLRKAKTSSPTTPGTPSSPTHKTELKAEVDENEIGASAESEDVGMDFGEDNDSDNESNISWEDKSTEKRGKRRKERRSNSTRRKYSKVRGKAKVRTLKSASISQGKVEKPRKRKRRTRDSSEEQRPKSISKHRRSPSQTKSLTDDHASPILRRTRSRSPDRVKRNGRSRRKEMLKRNLELVRRRRSSTEIPSSTPSHSSSPAREGFRRWRMDNEEEVRESSDGDTRFSRPRSRHEKESNRSEKRDNDCGSKRSSDRYSRDQDRESLRSTVSRRAQVRRSNTMEFKRNEEIRDLSSGGRSWRTREFQRSKYDTQRVDESRWRRGVNPRSGNLNLRQHKGGRVFNKNPEIQRFSEGRDTGRGDRVDSYVTGDRGRRKDNELGKRRVLRSDMEETSRGIRRNQHQMSDVISQTSRGLVRKQRYKTDAGNRGRKRIQDHKDVGVNIPERGTRSQTRKLSPPRKFGAPAHDSGGGRRDEMDVGSRRNRRTGHYTDAVVDFVPSDTRKVPPTVHDSGVRRKSARKRTIDREGRGVDEKPIRKSRNDKRQNQQHLKLKYPSTASNTRRTHGGSRVNRESPEHRHEKASSKPQRAGSSVEKITKSMERNLKFPEGASRDLKKTLMQNREGEQKRKLRRSMDVIEPKKRTRSVVEQTQKIEEPKRASQPHSYTSRSGENVLPINPERLAMINNRKKKLQPNQIQKRKKPSGSVKQFSLTRKKTIIPRGQRDLGRQSGRRRRSERDGKKGSSLITSTTIGVKGRKPEKKSSKGQKNSPPELAIDFFHPLAPCQKIFYKETLEKLLKGAEKKKGVENTPLTGIYNQEIRVMHLQCLRPSFCLHDEIINFGINKLQDRIRDEGLRILLLNSFFWTRLYPEERSQKISYKNVKRWTMPKKLSRCTGITGMRSIFELEYVLFPCHFPTSEHWGLGGIDIEGKRILYFDSNQPCEDTFPEHIFHGCMLNWLRKEWEDKVGGSPAPTCSESESEEFPALGHGKKRRRPRRKKREDKRFNKKNWKLYAPTNIPQQQNGTDCGVFCLLYMWYMALGKSFDFSQAHCDQIRKRLLFEIIRTHVTNDQQPSSLGKS